MKRVIMLFLVVAIVLLGAWCWVYRSYVEVQDAILEKSGSGDWSGAMEELREYQSQKASYPISKSVFLEKHHYRLLYNEGVINRKLGNFEGAEGAFRVAARSAEPYIAAASLYNLALHEIQKGNLEIARSSLTKALNLTPGDVESKVNLEILLKNMRAKDQVKRKSGPDLPKKPERKMLPGEQWRFDVPERDGQRGIGSRRRYL